MYAEGHDEGRLANQKHMAQIVLKNFNAPAMHEAINRESDNFAGFGND